VLQASCGGRRCRPARHRCWTAGIQARGDVFYRLYSCRSTSVSPPLRGGTTRRQSLPSAPALCLCASVVVLVIAIAASRW